MSVTIKDIARIAGVSHMTVSRALNNNEAVKPETREKIQAIAQELNYTKNINGRNLALNRFFNIGLYITSLVEGTSPQFLNEVITCIYSSIRGNYSLIIGSIQDSPNFESLNHQNFDGMIIVSQSKEDDLFIESVKHKGIPIVIMNRQYKGLMSVSSNDVIGAYKACRYMIEKGHRKLAFVEGSAKNVATALRRKGIKTALDEFKNQVEFSEFLMGDYSFDSGYKAGLQIENLVDKPTAVFCYNDDMAIALQRYLISQGLTEIKVMGFDGSIMTEYVNPSLTTVKRPIKIIAEKSIELLLMMIEGVQTDHKTYLYDQVIIERESL
ncbi:LacI family DNA-binding transcriptional regulator [Fusibacter sp. 3D3]|uniref:LacI family DNA-binding transcriptional regulator n=1 Tax=Fusibacter sp. 3D3 TaxID=1048380 RepID=UPI000852C9F3|nr:LacI family DNA-binding transcriptional regulator [Fusibacter sp. 3D3]GAU75733.1 hexuronate utilization operon transcriptional repressor ExuR [Fusibacter sp. 3D3]